MLVYKIINKMLFWFSEKWELVLVLMHQIQVRKFQKRTKNDLSNVPPTSFIHIAPCQNESLFGSQTSKQIILSLITNIVIAA